MLQQQATHGLEILKWIENNNQAMSSAQTYINSFVKAYKNKDM
jgi:hypothetical protein